MLKIRSITELNENIVTIMNKWVFLFNNLNIFNSQICMLFISVNIKRL